MDGPLYNRTLNNMRISKRGKVLKKRANIDKKYTTF